jgi:uncharacterized protein
MTETSPTLTSPTLSPATAQEAGAVPPQQDVAAIAAAGSAGPKPFWNPYAAGVALGLVLLTSFVITGRGLGSSGAYKMLGAAAIHGVSPTAAEENGSIGPSLHPGRSVLNEWIVFLALGTVAGGGLGALTARRFRWETIRGSQIARESRWVLAVTGGFIAGFAAQVARGCTSGQALTGGAQLALGSWVFMFSVFGGAYALAYFVRRQWL